MMRLVRGLRCLALLFAAVLAGCGREEADPPPGLEKTPPPVTVFPAWRTVRDEASARALVRAEAGRPAVSCTAAGTVDLPVDFTGDAPPARANWDVKITCDLRAAAGVQFDFLCEDLALFTGFNCYFHAGKGWYVGTFAPLADGRWFRVRVRRLQCGQEGACAGWGQVDTIRLSGWRAGTGKTRCRIRDLGPLEAPGDTRIAIIPAASCAAAKPGVRDFMTYADKMANTLDVLGAAARTVDDVDLTAESLTGVELAILPYNPGLATNAVAALESFVARGGRLLVCYALPAGMETLLGVRSRGYVRPEAEGRANLGGFVRTGKGLEGQPAFVLQPSWIAHAVDPGAGEVLAQWGVREGVLGATKTPALVRTRTGVFMSHVWLGGARGSQLDLMRALVGALAPSVRDAMAARRAGQEDLAREIRAWLARQPSVKDEFRGFWCHSAWGLGGEHDWDSSIAFLRTNGFNRIFANLAWGGTAFYDSKVLPVAPVVKRRGDAFTACRDACRRHGVEFHVWKVCWNMGGCATPEFARAMAASNRVQKCIDGTVRPGWLCPSHPLNRKLEVEALVELAKKGPDGIHFDYIRYPDLSYCFCDGCRARFERRLGRSVNGWPNAVRTDPELKKAWSRFRRDNIAAVVRDVRARVKQEAPRVKISAAVFSSVATCGESVGQEWADWCREGLLDFACPMNYVGSAAMLKSMTRDQMRRVGTTPVYAGIGLAKLPDDGTDAREMALQIEALRALGAKGFMVFNFDRRAETVLPLLHLGVTSD